ncbi:MAG: hypothetical protein RIC16_17425 [Rhodospirillales bacterium]
MTDQRVDEHFVDMLSNVSHANGVFRITLAQQETEDLITPQVKILIPANQLPRILQGVSDAVNEISRRVREAAEQAAETANAAEGSGKSGAKGKSKKS